MLFLNFCFLSGSLESVVATSAWQEIIPGLDRYGNRGFQVKCASEYCKLTLREENRAFHWYLLINSIIMKAESEENLL